MKTKIFWSTNEDPELMEMEMNEFFANNPNITITDKIPMTNNGVFWLILIYKEAPAL